jgi:hypothetical protein
MGCGCRQRQRNANPSILAEPGAPTLPLPAGGWSWRVLLPDGTVESGYDELGAVRRAKDSGGTYEAVLPS